MQKVTGRDGFIIKQALYCAIKFIDSLPEELQETSNQNDMKALLLATEPEIVELSQQIARLTCGRPREQVSQSAPIFCGSWTCRT